MKSSPLKRITEWVNRPEADFCWPCRYGHLDCSTFWHGPCLDEMLGKLEVTMTTIDRSDTAITIAQHSPSGDWYAVEIASLWDNDRCVGAKIIGAAGPLNFRDIPGYDYETNDLDWDTFQSAAWEFRADDGEWLEEHNPTYPFGLRR